MAGECLGRVYSSQAYLLVGRPSAAILPKVAMALRPENTLPDPTAEHWALQEKSDRMVRALL